MTIASYPTVFSAATPSQSVGETLPKSNMTEEKAFDALKALLHIAEVQAGSANGYFDLLKVPQIWAEIIAVHAAAFPVAPPAMEAVKKKRKRNFTLSPNLGWPAGVSRAEYKAWKAEQEANGVTEGLNPQNYKRMRDEQAGINTAKSGADFDDETNDDTPEINDSVPADTIINNEDADSPELVNQPEADVKTPKKSSRK